MLVQRPRRRRVPRRTAIPTEADLADWLPECPEATEEAAELLAAAIAPDLATACRLTRHNPEVMRWLDWPPACDWTADSGALLARVTWTGSGMIGTADLAVATVHGAWRARLPLRQASRRSRPIVDDWQRHAPPTVEPERRADRRLTAGAAGCRNPSVERERCAPPVWRAAGRHADATTARAGRPNCPMGAAARASTACTCPDLSEPPGVPLLVQQGKAAPLDAVRLLVHAAPCSRP